MAGKANYSFPYDLPEVGSNIFEDYLYICPTDNQLIGYF
jgi:hypothetical protein